MKNKVKRNILVLQGILLIFPTVMKKISMNNKMQEHRIYGRLRKTLG